MLLLGLLLMGGSVAFAVVLVADNLTGGPEYTVSLFDHHIGTVNTLGAFLAGIALTLVFCLALMMTSAGARRERRRSGELRAARRDRKAAAAVMARNADAADADNAAAATTSDTTTTGATTTKTDLMKRRSRGVHIFGH